MSGYSYDTAGNLLADGQHSYVYNAESQMASLDSGATAYVYDAAGMRVRKTTGVDWTEYLYWGADPVAERDQTGAWTEYVFFPAPGSGGAKRVARREPAGAVYYYFSDHLGSASVVTDPAGVIKEESDYYPYGGERVITDTLPQQNYKFTGKERDTESGLDYFGARYYSSGHGRFTSVDPSSASIKKSDPQSWNRYNYSLNNPLRYVDRNGKWPTETHNEIIRRAFPGLSQEQRQALMNTSAGVDRGQTKAHNHEHAMRSPGENPAAARRAIDQNIQNHEQAAQRAQGKPPEHVTQIVAGALNEFGQALHTVTDRTSPAHTDANGNPREWNGIPTTLRDVEAAREHNNEEATITPAQMDRAVAAAREAFKQTFGAKAAQEAQTESKKEEKKEKE